MCPYLFHLYQRNQLLTKSEEKEWRTQEVILKYGESGSDEEAEEEGFEPETEEEEEEFPKPPPKRMKTTSPHGRGTPPKPNPEAGPSRPTGQPDVMMTASEEMDSTDPFTNLINILCNVQADWEVKRITLSKIGKLLDAAPDAQLPRRVADCITNPEKNRKQAAKVQRLQGEVDVLKAEISAFKEDKAAAQEMAVEMKMLVVQVKTTLGESGDAATKARLFDKGVH